MSHRNRKVCHLLGDGLAGNHGNTAAVCQSVGVTADWWRREPYLAVGSVLLQVCVDALGDLKQPAPLGLQSVLVGLNRASQDQQGPFTLNGSLTQGPMD